MNSARRRVLTALLGGGSDDLPVTSVAGCAGTVCVDMQKAIGVYWPEALKDSGKMAELAIASCRLTGLECVRVPFDFVVEPEAMGCGIRWYDTVEGVPAVTTRPYEKQEDLARPDALLELGRIPTVLRTIETIRRRVGDSLPISSLAIGPFTLAGELLGTERLLVGLVKDIERVKRFVDCCVDIVIEYANAQYRAGSDIVQVAEPMASVNVISPMRFKEIVKPALIKIGDALGGIRVLHICGRTDLILPDMVETGFDGFSIENAAKAAELRPKIGDARILGSVPSNILAFGSPEDVMAESEKSISAGVALLEPACGISPQTPMENIITMVKAAKASRIKR